MIAQTSSKRRLFAADELPASARSNPGPLAAVAGVGPGSLAGSSRLAARRPLAVAGLPAIAAVGWRADGGALATPDPTEPIRRHGNLLRDM